MSMEFSTPLHGSNYSVSSSPISFLPSSPGPPASSGSFLHPSNPSPIIRNEKRGRLSLSFAGRLSSSVVPAKARSRLKSPSPAPRGVDGVALLAQITTGSCVRSLKLPIVEPISKLKFGNDGSDEESLCQVKPDNEEDVSDHDEEETLDASCGLITIVSPTISLVWEQSKRLQTLAENLGAKTGLNVEIVLPSTSKKVLQKNDIKKILKCTDPGTLFIGLKLNFHSSLSSLTFVSVIVSPEELANSWSSFEEFSFNNSTTFHYWVLDEAHCEKDWAFRQWNFIYQMTTLSRVFAVTATLFKRDEFRLIGVLGMVNPAVGRFIQPREDLYYGFVLISSVENLVHLLRSIFSQAESHPCIIYTHSHRHMCDIRFALNQLQIHYVVYFGAMPKENKTEVSEYITERDDNNVVYWVVATEAMGMGLDVRHVRTILHYSSPRTVAVKHQRDSRASHDGRGANCIVAYSSTDYKSLGDGMKELIAMAKNVKRGKSSECFGLKMDALLETTEKRTKRCEQCQACNPER